MRRQEPAPKFGIKALFTSCFCQRSGGDADRACSREFTPSQLKQFQWARSRVCCRSCCSAYTPHTLPSHCFVHYHFGGLIARKYVRTQILRLECMKTRSAYSFRIAENYTKHKQCAFGTLQTQPSRQPSQN